MQCPHCLVAFHYSEDDWVQTEIETENISSPYELQASICPDCKNPIVILRRFDSNTRRLSSEETIYPQAPRISPGNYVVSDKVPSHLKDDYIEAHNVLPISAKSSATLSRRVLQTVLQEHGYNKRDLSKQIDDVLNEADPEKVLPSQLRIVIDVIRHFGNFSAHTVTDETTLQIIDVESQEAEWCIQIIEDLFDHYYVRPAEVAKRLDDLNSKLDKAGKLPAKSYVAPPQESK